MNEHQFLHFKDRCDSVRQQRDRKEGALALLMKKLKDEFDCNTVEQAEILAHNIDQEVIEVDQQIEEEEFALKADYPQLFK